jgi:ATP-dependent helicase/nuclease subunit B
LSSNARCIAHLQSGGLVLTADLRQARILRRLHDRAQADAGLAVWPTAQVLPVDSWLAQQWLQAGAASPDLPGLLSPVSLRWLWRRAVTGSADELLDPADLAARARASWLRLRAHGGELAGISSWPLTRDQRAFVSWARAVEGELRSRNACDAGDLARLFVELGRLPAAGPPILLAGFRRQTPAQERFFAALAASGHAVESVVPSSPGAACFQFRAADPEGERRAMLGWLRARLAAAPGGVHALIVPDLETNRGALDRALAAALQPELELPGGEAGHRAFDLAGGPPLVSQPVADAALSALACATGPVDWTVASRLLLGAHVAGAGVERGPRIAADLTMRDSPGLVRIGAARLAEIAARRGAAVFASAATAAAGALAGARLRDAGAWAEAFGAALAAWAWPGEAPLSSHEFQAARHFRELLDELASLAAVSGTMTAAEALAELRRLATSPFQPESGEPVVFVLDAYDDPGVQLDSLWVAGMTATAWPRPAAVDPLLPIEIQRSLRMPGVSPEGAVAEAVEIVACWRARSGALVLSWPAIENDTEADATRLLPADAIELAAPPAAATREQLAFDNARLEPLPEEPLPPLAAFRTRGGARLLELQSQCPFRAFGEFRLDAAPLEEPQAGFDRRLRGIVLHRALERIWSELGDQPALAALGEPERRRRIAKAVDAALDAATPAGTGAAAIGLERDWQLRAVGRLLALDLERPPFTVVETERALALAIGGLELELRVDRVDRIGEELVVIDYKTGRVKNTAWRGARMDAPQLPLYAVLHPDRPTGIAFASVGAARARYVGVGRDGGIIPGIKPAERFALTEDRDSGYAWREIASHWRAWLERLAANVASGVTDVDPKLGADTCRYCHLSALCRVEAASPADVEEEGADGE